MQKYALLFCLFWICGFNVNVYAQILSMDMWHSGELDLTVGETLKGEIKYDLRRHWIEYRKDNARRVFSSFNVNAFQIIDAITKERRTFISLPFSQNRRYKRKLFFELLTEGTVSLFCREKIYTQVQVDNTQNFRNPNRISPYGNASASRIRSVRTVAYDYYYVRKQNQVIEFDPTEGNLFQLMRTRKRKIEEIMEDNNLDISDKNDLIIIFNYYNDLRKKQ